MKFTALLTFWMAHNESIIQWMLAIIIGSCIALVFRSFFGKKTESGEVLDGVSDLLKKVLDQTSVLEKALMTAPQPVVMAVSPDTVATTTVAAPTTLAEIPTPAAPAAPAIDPAEVAKLKLLIAEQTAELERFKANPASDKSQEHISKIQELESRLKEYEILEDDIADLSLYKDENARLKAELQRLVGAAPAAPGADALVDQFAQVVDQTKGMESPALPPESQSPLPQTGDPMADFVSAVQSERAAAAPATAEAADALIAAAADAIPPAPEPLAPPSEPIATPAPPTLAVVPPVAAAAPVEPLATVSAAVSASKPTQATDVFAEFSTGNLDTDRVMEELISLEKLPATDSKDALEGLDAEKMVAEAAGFSKS